MGNRGKKNNKQVGSLFSPEFLEVVSRLKDKEPELEEIVNRQGKQTNQQTGRDTMNETGTTTELLKPSEVARELKVKKNQVYKYIKQGLIPAARLPGSRLLRVRREDLEQYINQGFENRA